MKLLDKKGNIRPYKQEFPVLKLEYDNPVDDDNLYKMGLEMTGEAGNRQLVLSTGYDKNPEYTNTFILSKGSLEDFIGYLQKMLTIINKDAECNLEIELAYEELYRYIDMGIIESINLHKVDDSYPNYHPMLYIPFRVEPKFKSTEEIHEKAEVVTAPDVQTVNIGLQFIDCFHIDFSNPNPMIDKLTHNHPDIPITFSNYDLNAEFKKYRERIFKDVMDFNPLEKQKHDSTMREKAIEMGLIKDNK